MPLMMVWPLSGSVWTLNVGSSFASLESATPIFSWSPLVLGSTATEITGAGNSMVSSTMGCFSSQMVSPVEMFFRPTQAQMSPA